MRSVLMPLIQRNCWTSFSFDGKKLLMRIEHSQLNIFRYRNQFITLCDVFRFLIVHFLYRPNFRTVVRVIYLVFNFSGRSRFLYPVGTKSVILIPTYCFLLFSKDQCIGWVFCPKFFISIFVLLWETERHCGLVKIFNQLRCKTPRKKEYVGWKISKQLSDLFSIES